MSEVMMACGHAANATTGDGAPACAICAGLTEDATRVAADPALAGRVARCYCGREKPSSTALGFFEFRGEGSPSAIHICKNCSYSIVAHGPDASVWQNGKTAVQNANCPGFEPHGPWTFDTYYCGCEGWD